MFVILAANKTKTVELYHGTSTKRLPFIKKEGLDPHAPKASSGDNFVYLTDKPDVAAQFSGFGQDSEGRERQGYMTPLSGKLKEGVVLKVRVDVSKLAADHIWQKENGHLRKYGDLLKFETKQVTRDAENGELDFYIDNEVYRLFDENEIPEEDRNPDDYHYGEYWPFAQENVVKRFAKKFADKKWEELKKFSHAKLYQYSGVILPSDILEILPAKNFLKSEAPDSRSFGNNDPYAAA